MTLWLRAGAPSRFRPMFRGKTDIVRLFETAERELGPIKALVNNAGVTGGFARVDEVSSAAIANVMAVNVGGTILCSREAVRRMSTRHGGSGGAIVNISSLAARTGAAGEWVHYAASKGAIDSFTIGLAREVAAEGIRVNAVAPGLVETGLHAANGEPGRLQRLMGTIPMGRAGMPQRSSGGSAVAVVACGVVHDGCDSGDWRRAVRAVLSSRNSVSRAGSLISKSFLKYALIFSGKRDACRMSRSCAGGRRRANSKARAMGVYSFRNSAIRISGCSDHLA